MISGVGPNELRARQRRALNEITLEERMARAPEEPADFDCECGRPQCDARIRLTPREFAAFRRNFSAFVVAPEHELLGGRQDFAGVR
jgi:hypothetical protein